MKSLYLLVSLMVGLTVSGSVWAIDCVEVDIEAPAQAYLGETITLTGEITNCGDDAAVVEFTGTVTKDTLEFVSPPAHVFLAAGETRSKSVTIQIPLNPLAIGTYTACITATIGEAEDTDCTTVEILGQPGHKPKRPRKFETR